MKKYHIIVKEPSGEEYGMSIGASSGNLAAEAVLECFVDGTVVLSIEDCG